MKILPTTFPDTWPAFLSYLVVAGLLLVELTFGYKFLWPHAQRVWELKGGVSELTTANGMLEQTLAMLDSVNSQELLSLTAKAKASVPDEKKTTGLVSGFSAIASSVGLALSQVEFSPGRISTESAKTNGAQKPTVTKLAQSYPVSISSTGNLSQVGLFLRRINSASQIITVDSLDFSISSARLTTSIALQAYFQEPLAGDIPWNEISEVTATEKAILGPLPTVDQFTLPEVLAQ